MKTRQFVCFIVFLASIAIYLNLSKLRRPINVNKLVEGFSDKNISEDREDENKLVVFPDHNDSIYTRLFEIVTNEPAIYRFDIIQIKKKTKITEKSRVLDAGCGLGRHMEIIKELVPNVKIEGIDKSKSMINRCRIRNPGSELLCTSLTIPEIYKKEKLSHILCLHETLHHNNPREINKILKNFHKWLVPGGYLVVHIFDPKKLDPGPREFSQYFKDDDGTRHSLTYFESFTHEAWWEKETEKRDWYKYCEKYIFPKEKIKIQTTPLWIPPVNKMLEYISNHDFKLTEIIELKDIEITDFSLYVFKKK